MKNLSFEELEKAHKANNMFCLGTLSTGHIVFARIESTNFFEDEKDYSYVKGFKTEKLTQFKVEELKQLGFIPKRNCLPEEKPRTRYEEFYKDALLSKLTDKNDPYLVMCFDSEYFLEHRAYNKETGELLYKTFEQKEAKQFLKKSAHIKTLRNYEVLTSMACSFYMQGYFITFNIISPLDLLNNESTYEEIPKIDIQEFLILVFEKCGIDTGIFSKKSIDNGKLTTKSKQLKITILAHNGRAEWNKFDWFNTITFDKDGKYSKDEIGQPVMNHIANIQGGDTTIYEFKTLLPRSKSKFQYCSFFVADTMTLVDANHKKASAMGKMLDMGALTEKVSISQENISHMNRHLIQDPENYIRYAVQDTIVPLVYVASLYGVNVKPDITLLTGGQRVVIEQLKNQYLNNASNYSKYIEKYIEQRQLTNKNGGRFSFKDKKKGMSKEGFDLIYRGLIPEHKKTENSELPLYEKDGLIAVNGKMRDLLLMAQRAYTGGENFCNTICIPKDKTIPQIQSTKPKTKWKPNRKTTFTGKETSANVLTYDLDIPSAYPTCIYPISAVNVVDPIAYEQHKLITIDGGSKGGKDTFSKLKRNIVNEINNKNKGNGKLNKFDLGIPGFVEIEECITPDGIRPLLSAKLKGENVPINPKHFKLDGNVQQNNTFTFMELQQCVDLGCKLTISKIVIANPVFADNGLLFRPLGQAVVEIIKLRKKLAKLYGKKSLPALICKLIANGVYYGKTAQNCIPTKTYTPIDNEEESVDRGPSRLTQPVFASYITAGTRCILSSAGYAMFKHNYDGWVSQTTDGGITYVPEFLVNKWSNTTIPNYFKEVRSSLSLLTEGKEDNRLFIMKHINQELYNLTTRGNVGFCYDKEIQVPVGYKHEKEGSRGYVYETYYVEHLLTETEKKEIFRKKGEDYIVDGVCAMQGFKSQKGYEKGSEEYKKEIVEAYLQGTPIILINTYKPESLTQAQKKQIHLPNDEQREFPMSVMQKTVMKMNFDFKSIPDPENFEDIEMGGMYFAVGKARAPKDNAEAMAYRKVIKNTNRSLRNVWDLEYTREKVKKYKPLTKEKMRYFLQGYTLGLFEKVKMLEELQGQERVEFINDFIKNGEELSLVDMNNYSKVEYSESNRKVIESYKTKGVFEKIIVAMKEVGKD